MLEQRDDWSDIVAALGEKSVKAVAEAFDVTPGAITSALLRTGTRREPVHAAGAPAPVKKPSKSKKPASSTINGLYVREGTNDHKIAEHADILGSATDAHVGELAGVSARTVAAFRRRNGIKGKRGRRPSKKTESASALPPEKQSKPTSAKKKLRQRGKPSKLDPFAHLLGPKPDAEVAEMAGVSANAAAAYRRRRGLPSHREWKASQAASAAAEQAAPAAEVVAPAKSARPRKPKAASSGSAVFRVSLPGGEHAFVVASDLVEAARLAAAHGATGVELGGRLLG